MGVKVAKVSVILDVWHGRLGREFFWQIFYPSGLSHLVDGLYDF